MRARRPLGMGDQALVEFDKVGVTFGYCHDIAPRPTKRCETSNARQICLWPASINPVCQPAAPDSRHLSDTTGQRRANGPDSLEGVWRGQRDPGARLMDAMGDKQEAHQRLFHGARCAWRAGIRAKPSTSAQADVAVRGVK
jgi:hypothetical protein